MVVTAEGQRQTLGRLFTMVEFESFFRGSRFVFWSIAPFALLTGIVLAITMEDWTLWSVVSLVVVEVGIVLLVMTLARPHRWSWAGRALAGLLLFGYAAFTVDLIASDTATTKHILMAVAGLVWFALPCFFHAAFGLFVPDEKTPVR